MAKAIAWFDLELIRMLGEGQAGKVWLAKLKHPLNDIPAGSSVAIKCYKSWVLEEPGQFERIIRELELGRKIIHPNLVKTLSIIRDPEGRPALVMNYYDGETLESYLENRRNRKVHTNLDFAFTIIGNLASAISTVHQAGAIHRDVKPANIILSDGLPILMDLGVVSSKDFPEQTTSGAFLGTIRYAAPEYLFGEGYNSSIDVYALGAIAYEFFKNEPFPSKETQWARLIVEKNKHEIRLDYRGLERRYGLNTTEFIRFILGRTLAKVEKRVIDLNYLSEVIRSRLWERPFYVDNDKLVEGEPKVRALRGKDKDSQSNLRDVMDDLRNVLTNEDIAFLRQLLKKDYYGIVNAYNSYDHTYYDWHFSDKESRLQEAGCIVNIGGDEGGIMYRLHETVIAAYRYGYL
jgi:serine/threonine protein kinase